MKIDASLVRELREMTGAGILDSKKALEESNGDITKAIEILKSKGSAKAIKKSGNIAAEGRVISKKNQNCAVLVEINSETDFVAMNDKFIKLLEDVSNKLLDTDFSSTDEAKNAQIDNQTIDNYTSSFTATIGEKISFRRAIKIKKQNDNQIIGVYTHVNGRISVAVIINNGNDEVAKNIAMHVAAMNPIYMDMNDVPKNILDTYKKEIQAELENVNKPENIKKMMIEGMISKRLSEITLVNQPFVMENKQTVGQYLKSFGSSISQMVRYELGEGITKDVVDFAKEVASQMK